MTYLNLPKCCKITKGISRGLIIDVERNIYCEIPLRLAKYLNEVQNIIYGNLDQNDKELITGINFLINEKFLINTGKINSLSSSIYYESPFDLEDILIDVDKDLEPLHLFIQKNTQTSIETLQIRFFSKIDLCKIEDLIFKINNLKIKFIEIILPHNKYTSEQRYNNFLNQFPQIARFIVFNHPSKSKLHHQGRLIFLKKNITSQLDCGKTSLKHMLPNLRTYLSSHNCNTCLNKKLGIDIEGKIKNCPSMKSDFGNIKEVSLKSVFQTSEFQKLWNLNKDNISICKDCEYRNICTDCRAFIEDPKDIFSKPLKCGYNPYTMEWHNWKVAKFKQKSIQYYAIL